VSLPVSAQIVKVYVIFVVSLPPFSRVEQLDLHWTIFHGILYWESLLRFVDQSQLLKWGKINLHFACWPTYIYVFGPYNADRPLSLWCKEWGVSLVQHAGKHTHDNTVFVCRTTILANFQKFATSLLRIRFMNFVLRPCYNVLFLLVMKCWSKIYFR
jgi:hypothetical protein